jgi:peptide/nickel transport system permease protein
MSKLESDTLQPLPLNEVPANDPPAHAATFVPDPAGYISYWGLVWWRFRRNHIGVLGGITLILLYLVVLPAEFTAPYVSNQRHSGLLSVSPQPIRFFTAEGQLTWPFVYGLQAERDPQTLRRRYVPNLDERYRVRLFVRAEESWSLLGITSNLHLFGVEEGGKIFLLGTDTQGRDLLTQILFGGRISLTVGLVGVALSLILGTIVGLLSGFLGGRVDDVIQRGIEVLISFPGIPLWIALSAAIPPEWNSIQVFFGITIILSVIGWGSLARVVRGLTLAMRSEDFVLAGRVNGATTWWIITRHLFPGTLSYIIVTATLAVPNMILGETALSFLGLGIQPPMISWGVLLQQAQDITALAHTPWLMTPVVFIVIAVLSFNFLGDGLRDAADPFSSR